MPPPVSEVDALDIERYIRAEHPEFQDFVRAAYPVPSHSKDIPASAIDRLHILLFPLTLLPVKPLACGSSFIWPSDAVFCYPIARIADKAPDAPMAAFVPGYIAVLCAGGGIGQLLSLLLKLDPLVTSLYPYDIHGALDVAADVSHVDTNNEVTGLAADKVDEALECTEVTEDENEFNKLLRMLSSLSVL
ncbi:hypothetical protein OE88DRAFT_1728329 [Heliocybe sulcata]|uniref:Uncharacterized protein n=1 Tax=Heliocybe sulcata TaxID=5364 RepID=A0A5C3MRI3_9AGAM|nr:hypothetical protein OE88DRAFT_1728329 [Heliocybe sulcata]